MSSSQEECVLCCSEISIYAVGKCDHPVCHQCSARMRVLCETTECPICRSDMPIVVWTLKAQNFSSTKKANFDVNKKFKIAFENEDVKAAFNSLLLNRCSACGEEFDNFSKLSEHARRKHDLHYCDLCTENLKIFPFEKKTYSRKDLARHKRIGDPEDTSHRGHPLCEFCDQRYIDTDELFRHLRREHYFCHFCDADGNHEFYEDYEYLRVHFRKHHFLCEEEDCVNERFIGAFRSEIDLKAHIAVEHCKNKSKSEARQARIIDTGFMFPSRPSGSSSPRSGRYSRRQNVEENRSSSRNLESAQKPKEPKINTTSTLEFPSLSEENNNLYNGNLPIPVQNFTSVGVQSTSQKPNAHNKKGMYPDDFPALSSSSGNTLDETKKVSLSQPSVTQRAGLSAKISQAKPQPKQNSQAVENKPTTWGLQKKTFDDDFPKLEPKKTVSNGNPMNNAAVNANIARPRPTSAVPAVPISTHVSNGDQFVTIKSKSKKKKPRSGASTNKTEEDEDDFSNMPNFLLANSYSALNQENEDPFRKNLVRNSGSSRNSYIEEPSWRTKVSFASDDFPPLAPAEVNRKPPGINAPKKKQPPPGFSANTCKKPETPSVNITLSAIARQLASSKNIDSGVPSSDFTFWSPPDFHSRSLNLVQKIKALSVYDEFKSLSGNFIKNDMSASCYYEKCLEILGDSFNDIFPELIALLPNINKQQELLDIHRKHQNHGGAMPKLKSLNNNQIAVCDICYQVLLEKDVSAHGHD